MRRLIPARRREAAFCHGVPTRLYSHNTRFGRDGQRRARCRLRWFRVWSNLASQRPQSPFDYVTHPNYANGWQNRVPDRKECLLGTLRYDAIATIPTEAQSQFVVRGLIARRIIRMAQKGMLDRDQLCVWALSKVA